MDNQSFSEWLGSMSEGERRTALIRIYSTLTVHTREFFIPGTADGREKVIIKMLQGINELHHTIANRLGAGEEGLSPFGFGQQLNQIAEYYRIEPWLKSAVEAVRAHYWPGKQQEL